jgi:ribosomal protein S19
MYKPKNFFIASNLLRKNLNKKITIKIWSRSSVIPFCLVGSYVLIYNGKIFKKLFIKREHVGFKFGQFSFTRIPPKRIKKKKK